MSHVTIHHYMPELGGPTAGSSVLFDASEVPGIMHELERSLRCLKPGERLVVETQDD